MDLVIVFAKQLPYEPHNADREILVKKVINSVRTYGYLNDSNLFYFTRGENKHFLPRENVIFFGQASAWREDDDI